MQNDGSAPPHFALTVRSWLDQHFSGRWLGRRGPHEWPPRSPDLTPCDFYLWGYTKEEVYKTKPRTLEDFEIRIQQVLNAIPNDILLKVVRSIPGRLMKQLKQMVHTLKYEYLIFVTNFK